MHVGLNVLIIAASLLIVVIVTAYWAGRAMTHQHTPVGFMLGLLLAVLLVKISNWFIPGGSWIHYSWWFVGLVVVGFILSGMLVAWRDGASTALIVILAVVVGVVTVRGLDLSTTPTAKPNNVCSKHAGIQLVAVHDTDGKARKNKQGVECGDCPVVTQAVVLDAKTKHTKVDKHDHAVCTTAATSPSTPTSTTTTTTVPRVKNDTISDANADKIACATLKLMGGMPCNAIKVGKKVNFNNHTQVRGSAAFSKVTLKSQTDIAAFLASSTPQSVAARQRLQQALSKFPGENQRALNGVGYVPIQFSVAVQYFGTTYFANNQVINEESARVAPANDILWLFFTRKGMIIPGASIRADCGNEHFTAIVPVTPSTPSAPPISQPPVQPPPPVHHVPSPPVTTTTMKCWNHPWPQRCGDGGTGIDKTGVQKKKQRPTKGVNPSQYNQGVQSEKPPADKYKPNPTYGANPPADQSSPPGASQNPSDPPGSDGGDGNTPTAPPNPVAPTTTPPCWVDLTTCGPH